MQPRALLLLPPLLTLTLGLAASPAVQGAGQLKGGDGVPGQTYTLNAGTPAALNFTLLGAEYSADHFITDPGTNDERDYLRPAGKKLAVLHFTVQNPQKVNTRLRGDTLVLSGVDSNNKQVGRVYGSGVYDEITRKSVNADLQPAQKINLVMAMELDSRASLPKLLVEANRSTHAVWRYAPKIAPVLPAALRDPSVANGSASLDVGIPGTPGTYYPGKDVDFRVNALSYAPGPLLGKTAPAGGKLLLVNLSFRNVHGRLFKLGNAFPPVRVKLYDQDGLGSGEAGKFFLASRDQELSGDLMPGKDVALRLVVSVPAGVEPARLEFTDAHKRTFDFPLSGVR